MSRAPRTLVLALTLLAAPSFDAPSAEQAAGEADAGPPPGETPCETVEAAGAIEWLPARGRECRRYRGRRVCDGPRMTPEPHGEAAALAERLGLGGRRAASTLLLGPPRPEWVQAVAEPRPERLLWPVPDGSLWRGFGRVRRAGRRRLHRGVDIGAPEGAPIVAVAPGLVAYADNGSRGYGNLLMVVHGDGSVAFYAHCRALLVFAGRQVRAGETIAEVGTTGITHGAHLHFELRVDGAPVDPLPLLDGVPPRRPRRARGGAIRGIMARSGEERETR